MNTNDVLILAIESSCDDTAAAVLRNDEVLSNVVAGQSVHEAYGGVVPELASRAHQQHIVPVVHQAISKAGITLSDLKGVAFTRGPGLLGSLVVGTSFAKSMAMGLNIALLPVHHMQAHILAHFIKDAGPKKPQFPFLALTISGGHTQIVLVRSYFDMEIIGQTLDDAIGEAFDKSAILMGLPYPGGALIDAHARKGNPHAFTFPVPKVKGLDFSFSGLKTSVLYFLQEKQNENPGFVSDRLDDICASLQFTLIKIVMEKLKKAVKQTGINRVAIGGGVSANSGIREALQQAEIDYGWETFIPKFEYTTDNAAMIGIVGYFKYLDNQFSTQSISARARLNF